MILDALCARRHDLRHAVREARLAEQDIAAAGTPEAVDLDAGDKATIEGASRRKAADMVIGIAEGEWATVVAEPPGPNSERIRSYIYDGLGWPERRWPYERDGDFAWCGAFAAFCYAAAGLRAEVRHKHLASTYRLWRWASGTDRLRVLGDAMLGDIVIVGHERSKRWGSHITLCRGVESGALLTFEGNARGKCGDGRRREGVIARSRPWPRDGLKAKRYRVMHVIRPLASDYA